MTATQSKGTNNADSAGKKDGSGKKSDSERIDLIVDLLERNGMSLPKGLR